MIDGRKDQREHERTRGAAYDGVFRPPWNTNPVLSSRSEPICAPWQGCPTRVLPTPL
jgi:hypothetical protein